MNSVKRLVNTLVNSELDWAVNHVEGVATGKPSMDWSLAGPIIERAGIDILLRYGSLPPNHVQDVWDAVIKPEFYKSGRPRSGVKKEVIASGPNPLVAAMRAYVISRVGDKIEIPLLCELDNEDEA